MKCVCIFINLFDSTQSSCQIIFIYILQSKMVEICTLYSPTHITKNPNLVMYFTVLSLAIMFSNQQNCNTTLVQQGNSSLNCQMNTSVICLGSQRLVLVSCQYDSQCPNTNSTCRMKSNSSIDCNSKCFTSSLESSSQWLHIVIAVVLIFIIVILFACLVRKCRNPPPQRNIRIIYIVPLEQLGTQRRLSENENIPQFEPNWMSCDGHPWPPSQDTCIICLQPTQTACLSCNHYFHSSCIKQWLKIRRSCPTCKNHSITSIKILCKICKLKELSCPPNHFLSTRINQACPDCFVEVNS